MEISSGLLLTRLPDEEKHGNHLRAPFIAITDLRLTAAGKSSKFHLPENAPKPEGDAKPGNDDFNFLPEHDTCELIFELDNPFEIIDRGRLELYDRFSDKPLWTLDLTKLGLTWLRHGKHTVKWDGRIVKSDAALAGEIDNENTKHDLTGQTPQPGADEKAPFPDGWVTLDHPPYKLRLAIESDMLPDYVAEAWTFFHVLLKKIELKLGPEEAIPDEGAAPSYDDDKAIRKQIEDAGGLPASDKTREVYLLSNLYKNSSAEFEPNSTSDFDTYKTLWEEGPRIPILAKLWMKAADGSEIDLETASKGAVALGRAKFMWDWEDPDEVPKAVDAEATTFLDSSRNYYKNATDGTRAGKNNTYPQGDNCHVDRGGKRGPDAQPVFPDQDGYAAKDTLDAKKFPFTVGTKAKETNKRKWAAYSEGWRKGKLKGHTGVLFRPGRFAGDNYVISVQLAYDWKSDRTFTIDVTDKELKLPADLTKKTGKIEIWRRIHLSRYIRKTAGVPDFLGGGFGAVAGYYKQAFVELKNEVKGPDNYLVAAHKAAPGDADAIDYDALCRTHLGAAGFDLYDEEVIAASDEQHHTVAATFKVVKYATFVRNVHEKHFGHPASDFTDEAASAAVTVDVFATGLGSGAARPLLPAIPANAAVNARRTRINATRTYIRTQGYWGLQAFSATLEEKLKPAAKKIAVNLKGIGGCGPSGAEAPAGITALHFEYLHSGTKEYVDAGNVDHDGLRGSALDVVGRKRDKVLFVFWRPRTDTFAHECGHHLFLPHPKPPHSSNDAKKVHDKADTQCLMSYDPARHGFCGFCQLRLRGWNPSALKNDAAKNKKP